MNDDQFSLFELEVEQPKPDHIVEKSISPEQILELRRAFNASGFTAEVKQAEIIRSCVIRPVQSLEQLLARDVRPILRRIEERSKSRGPATGSAWDNREEDTWIDKL
ncbi:hypothetical protein [Crystallibacter degradans]|uniref:hypothetical protein n=1 Tax=Crystallibacter degradans TaxID=2726743 RepID=UPI0014753398|nr:hypothetical protein [Arthrobacter sp. SF27]NMR32386.1 hypothetical protein [Arthrobacter sp. SF27]